MEKIIVALALVCLTACGPVVEKDSFCGDQDPSECAIEQWQSVVKTFGSSGDVGACRATLEATVIGYDTRSAVKRECEKATAGGCVLKYDDEGAVIVLQDTEFGHSVDTAAHEMMHVLLQCTSGDPDAHHMKKVWGRLLLSNVPGE